MKLRCVGRAGRPRKHESELRELGDGFAADYPQDWGAIVVLGALLGAPRSPPGTPWGLGGMSGHGLVQVSRDVAPQFPSTKQAQQFVRKDAARFLHH